MIVLLERLVLGIKEYFLEIIDIRATIRCPGAFDFKKGICFLPK